MKAAEAAKKASDLQLTEHLLKQAGRLSKFVNSMCNQNPGLQGMLGGSAGAIAG